MFDNKTFIAVRLSIKPLSMVMIGMLMMVVLVTMMTMSMNTNIITTVRTGHYWLGRDTNLHDVHQGYGSYCTATLSFSAILLESDAV